MEIAKIIANGIIPNSMEGLIAIAPPAKKPHMTKKVEFLFMCHKQVTKSSNKKNQATPTSIYTVDDSQATKGIA